MHSIHPQDKNSHKVSNQPVLLLRPTFTFILTWGSLVAVVIMTGVMEEVMRHETVHFNPNYDLCLSFTTLQLFHNVKTHDVESLVR